MINNVSGGSVVSSPSRIFSGVSIGEQNQSIRYNYCVNVYELPCINKYWKKSGKEKLQENDTSLSRWVISQVFSILLCRSNMSRFAFKAKTVGSY